jgi:hypothetical protein
MRKGLLSRVQVTAVRINGFYVCIQYLDNLAILEKPIYCFYYWCNHVINVFLWANLEMVFFGWHVESNMASEQCISNVLLLSFSSRWNRQEV